LRRKAGDGLELRIVLLLRGLLSEQYIVAPGALLELGDPRAVESLDLALGSELSSTCTRTWLHYREGGAEGEGVAKAARGGGGGGVKRLNPGAKKPGNKYFWPLPTGPTP
jgi:hypothetical protein